MRFLSELNGREFTYGSFNSSNYGLIFANYQSDFETKMGGSYETQRLIPMHGLRFGVLQQKYKEPYSGEFEIVKENGVLSDDEAEEVYKMLFMGAGKRYWRLNYVSPSELTFDFKLKVTNDFGFSIENYLILYNLPTAYRPASEMTFDVTGSANDLDLFILSNGNVGLRTKDLQRPYTTEVTGEMLYISGTYRPATPPGYVALAHDTLQSYKTANYTAMQPLSQLTSLSRRYIRCMLTDPSIIEGGSGRGTTDANGYRVSGNTGWGTVGFKFTLTADSQYCWRDTPGRQSGNGMLCESGPVVTPPVIWLSMADATTLYNNSNTISFICNSRTTTLSLPGTVYDTATGNNRSLIFVIDSEKRQIYARDSRNNIITTVTDTSDNTERPIGNYFNGIFPDLTYGAYPYGPTVSLTPVSGNISNIDIMSYRIGDLL